MRTVVGAIFTSVILLFTAACFRVDWTDLRLTVPGLVTGRDLVLVTNAAQRELMGEMPDIRHECTFDFQRSWLVYYEGPRLQDALYRARLLTALNQVGYPVSAISLSHDPSPPMYAANFPHPIVVWPDRYRLILHIPALNGNLDANRVTDAIAYARLGGRPDNLRVDANRRTVTIVGQNRLLSTFGNYAHSIATAGYDVKGWADYDRSTAPPARGWQPFEG